MPLLDGALIALKHQSAGAAYADWVDGRLDEWAVQGQQVRRQRIVILALSWAAAAVAAAAAFWWWRSPRPARSGLAPVHSHASSSGSEHLLKSAFDLTSIPMFVVQPPDLILERNTTARTLLNGTMVLPPELSAVATRLTAFPPETEEAVEWAPPGHPPVVWQARLLPLPEGRSLLTLVR